MLNICISSFTRSLHRIVILIKKNGMLNLPNTLCEEVKNPHNIVVVLVPRLLSVRMVVPGSKSVENHCAKLTTVWTEMI